MKSEDKFLPFLLLSSLVYADDYSFDMDSIEVKSYKYSGYIKGEHKFLKTPDDEIHYLKAEADLKFKYFKDALTFDSELIATYTDIDSKTEDDTLLSYAYLNYKANSNFSFDIGKKSLKWGKGYFVNPVAFLERKKNPNDPESSREGFMMGSMKYNKSLSGALKNYSIEIVYLKNDEDINEEFATIASNTLAIKSYFLLYDTDIEIIYAYNDESYDKIGLDFSKNIQTNFEIHGEWAKTAKYDTSHLLGLKYLTEFELTITAEYLNNSKEVKDVEYAFTKLSQKEPFDWLYSSIYLKNTTNLDDNSHTSGAGVTYRYKDNLLLDLSLNINDDDESSVWSKVVWYF